MVVVAEFGAVVVVAGAWVVAFVVAPGANVVGGGGLGEDGGGGRGHPGGGGQGGGGAPGGGGGGHGRCELTTAKRVAKIRKAVFMLLLAVAVAAVSRNETDMTVRSFLV